MCDLCYERDKEERTALMSEIRRIFPTSVPKGKKYVLHWYTNIDDIGLAWWVFTKDGEYHFTHMSTELPRDMVDAYMSRGEYIWFMAWESMAADRLREFTNFLKLEIKDRRSALSLFKKS